MALSFILITACYQPGSQKQQTSTGNLESPADCKVVRHKLGESCIPTHPKRVVILDEFYILDAISALGIKPMGYAACFICVSSNTLSKFVSDIPDVGDMDSPSLEKILNLKPDLILGLEWQEKSYPLLSKIAPTVMIEEPEISGFKNTLKYIAEILDRSDLVEGILAKYESKVQDFQQQLGEKLQNKTVSVLGVDGASLYVNKLENNIYGQVMLDLGIQFAPAHQSIKNNGYIPVSIETLPDWDSDFLFILQNYERHAEDFEAILQQPIWSTLEVVQNKRVHPIILDVWGSITATQFIDDLYQYFISVL
ncbi:MAG: iron-siderophore ABC transporter substrate-binding protein [Cyanobacteria bacterium P01_G01_bin.67]